LYDDGQRNGDGDTVVETQLNTFVKYTVTIVKYNKYTVDHYV